VGKHEQKRPLEDLHKDGRMLKWIFVVWNSMGWIHLNQDINKRWTLVTMDHGNAPSGSAKCRTLLPGVSYLLDHNLIMKTFQY
jgi:hypothetical protein